VYEPVLSRLRVILDEPIEYPKVTIIFDDVAPATLLPAAEVEPFDKPHPPSNALTRNGIAIQGATIARLYDSLEVLGPEVANMDFRLFGFRHHAANLVDLFNRIVGAVEHLFHTDMVSTLRTDPKVEAMLRKAMGDAKTSDPGEIYLVDKLKIAKAVGVKCRCRDIFSPNKCKKARNDIAHGRYPSGLTAVDLQSYGIFLSDFVLFMIFKRAGHQIADYR